MRGDCREVIYSTLSYNHDDLLDHPSGVAPEVLVDTHPIHAEDLHTPVFDEEDLVDTPALDDEDLLDTPVLDDEEHVDTPVLDDEGYVDTPAVGEEGLVVEDTDVVTGLIQDYKHFSDPHKLDRGGYCGDVVGHCDHHKG